MRCNLMAGLGLAASLLAGASSAAATGYKVIDKIPGPDGAWDYLRVDIANNRLLVAHGSSVTVVDLATKAVTPGFAPGLLLHDAMPIKKGAEVLVTNGGSAQAVFVDGKSGSTIASVKTGVGPDGETADPATGMLYVMEHVGGNVVLIDPTSHAAVGSIPVGGRLEGAAADGKGHLFVNVEDKSEIAVVDIAKKAVVSRIALKGRCEGPTGIAYDAADNQVISACDGTTVLVDAASLKVLASLPTGGGADAIAFDAKQKLAFVPAGDDGVLALVKVGKGKAEIIDKVKTEPGARTVAVDERTGRAYIPSAEFGPKPAGGGHGRIVPGTFHIIVVGK
ncbi:MAG TPA: YncE family protein [Phenylobacterium sp.]|nr:YncE family protein [Phenylobacterium sp.]